MLSRIIYGSQPTLIISFASIAIGLVIGGTAGMLAAYTGKIFDTVANAIAFVIISFPPLLAILVIVAFWGRDLLKLTIIFAVAPIPQLFVVIRATTLAYVNRDFVTAARTMGARTPRILFREILPNVAPAGIVLRSHRRGDGRDHRGLARLPRAVDTRAASVGREHHLRGDSLPAEQQRHLDHAVPLPVPVLPPGLDQLHRGPPPFPLRRPRGQRVSRSGDRRQLSSPRSTELEGPFSQVEDLHTSFVTDRGLVRAVDGVSFELERGQTLGVVGESGSGKTVLSRSMMGLLPATRVQHSGTVRFSGHEISRLSRRQSCATSGGRRSRWSSRTR